MKSLATLGNELYSAKTSIAFVGKRKIWYVIAVVIILGSATLLGTVGLTPGIDFKGGSEITVTGLSAPSERPANEVLSKSDLAASSSVTTMGSSSVRVQTTELSKQRLDSLAGQLATAYKTDASNVSATTVGPTWSSDVTKKAIRGLILFFIFVGLLIWAYFRTWKMAAAALLALCLSRGRSISAVFRGRAVQRSCGRGLVCGRRCRRSRRGGDHRALALGGGVVRDGLGGGGVGSGLRRLLIGSGGGRGNRGLLLAGIAGVAGIDRVAAYKRVLRLGVAGIGSTIGVFVIPRGLVDALQVEFVSHCCSFS